MFRDLPIDSGGTIQRGLAGNRIQGGFYGSEHVEVTVNLRVVEHCRRVRREKAIGAEQPVGTRSHVLEVSVRRGDHLRPNRCAGRGNKPLSST